MKKKLILIAVLAVIVGIYFFYVRGFGVRTRVPSSMEITVGSEAKNFSWKVLSPMPTKRTEVTAAGVGTKIYVFGGFDGRGKTLKTVEVYDTETNSWSVGPEMPEERHHASAVAAGDFIYVVGGYTGKKFTPYAEMFILNTKTGKWSIGASLPAARGAAAAAYWNEQIILAGGVGENGLVNELAVYDIRTNKWNLAMPSGLARDHLAAAVVDNRFYVAGGRQNSLTTNLGFLEIYIPGEDRWSQGPDMPTPRGGVAGAELGGLFVVVGGEKLSGTFREVEAFDPSNARWLTLPPLPTPRHGLAAVTVGNKMYVIGGGKRPGLSVSGANEVLEIK